MSGEARPRRAPKELQALIAANAVLWAGEAEVVSTYFASPKRSAVTDEVWLGRQCFKEMIDGVVGRLTQLSGVEMNFERTASRANAALSDAVVRAELKHYGAFAIAHRISQQECGALVSARVGSDWPENAELQTLRARHRREFGVMGHRAAAFTEGGYCTLYRAGMALAGRSHLDDAIAAACAQVFDDEWDHMLRGIVDAAETPLPPEEWSLLERLTVEQGRVRIRMRNAQFCHPVSAARVRELEAGAAAPLAFDYTRAGLLPP